MAKVKDALVLFQKDHRLLEDYQHSTARPSDSSSSSSSIVYDIHLLQLGFYPVTAVGKRVQK
jgi:hypothetical protein